MSGYNKITIYGETKIGYIHSIERIVDNSEIKDKNKFNNIGYIPEWDEETKFLADFSVGINGGLVDTLNSPLVSWSVYKKGVLDNQFKFVQRVPISKTSIIDYNIAHESEYQYLIFPETQDANASSILVDDVKSCWGGWVIFDILEFDDLYNSKNLFYADLENMFIFDTNVNSGTQEQVIDKYKYDGFTQFSKVSIGERNYTKGSVSCLMTQILDTKLINTVELQDRFTKFIVNGNKKLLKDRKGNSYIVDIQSVSYKVNDNIGEQPVSVDFEYIQIDDARDLSVVEYEDIKPDEVPTLYIGNLLVNSQIKVIQGDIVETYNASKDNIDIKFEHVGIWSIYYNENLVLHLNTSFNEKYSIELPIVLFSNTTIGTTIKAFKDGSEVISTVAQFPEASLMLPSEGIWEIKVADTTIEIIDAKFGGTYSYSFV